MKNTYELFYQRISCLTFYFFNFIFHCGRKTLGIKIIAAFKIVAFFTANESSFFLLLENSLFFLEMKMFENKSLKCNTCKVEQKNLLEEVIQCENLHCLKERKGRSLSACEINRQVHFEMILAIIFVFLSISYQLITKILNFILSHIVFKTFKIKSSK